MQRSNFWRKKKYCLCNRRFLYFSLFIFPHAGPDIKYLLGFIRTQLSTSVTVALVFGPKVSYYYI